MTYKLFALFLFVSSIVFSNNDNTSRWAFAFGKSFGYEAMHGINVRLISPMAAIYTEDNPPPEKWEVVPEESKKLDMLIEFVFLKSIDKNLLGSPAIFFLTTNVRYDVRIYKKLSLKVYAGVKNKISSHNTYAFGEVAKDRRGEILKPTVGLSFQLNWRSIQPFADVSMDYLTIGTKLYLKKIFRKEKKRYNLT